MISHYSWPISTNLCDSRNSTSRDEDKILLIVFIFRYPHKNISKFFPIEFLKDMVGAPYRS